MKPGRVSPSCPGPKVRRASVGFALGFLAACGPVGTSKSSVGTTPIISYSLERTHTGLTTNALLFEYPSETSYQFRLSNLSAGVTTDTPLDEILPLTPRVDFAFAGEGSYSVDVELLQYNDVPYAQETLTWVYSTVRPIDPIVSFSELATSDTAVSMLIASIRAQEDDEIWVEGDLGGPHASGGFWDILPESGIYLLDVSSEDGLKEMTVKLRNVYGNESDPVAASIVKKSTAPTNCQATMDGTGSARTRVNLQLFADNDGPLYYNITGDVEFVGDYLPFDSGDYVEARLSSGEGEKRVVVHIRDAASNYCDDIVHTFDVSAGYVSQLLEIDGTPYYVTDDEVDLNIRYDHYPEEAPIEMRLSGDITDQTPWIPYSTSATVNLTAGAGEKTIFAQFRNADNEESFLVSTKVFLNPSVTLVDVGAPNYNVVISNIRGMESVSIAGCSVAYTNVAWAATYACTLAAADVDVTYTFEDETTLVLSDAP